MTFLLVEINNVTRAHNPFMPMEYIPVPENTTPLETTKSDPRMDILTDQIGKLASAVEAMIPAKSGNQQAGSSNSNWNFHPRGPEIKEEDLET